MGIAIIKGLFGANALGRTMHNVTPKDGSRRKLFTTSDLRDVRWGLNNGVYEVTLIDLGEATQHYNYTLCDSQGNALQSQVGVTINLINGTITLDSNYNGSAIYAKVAPITDLYYLSAVATPAVLVKEAEEIQDTYSLEVAYHGELGLTAEAHSTVALTSFVLKKNSTTVIANVTEMDTAVRAGTLTVSASVTTLGVSSWISVKEVRSLLIAKNTGAVRQADVLVTCTYEGKSITDSFTVVLLPNELESVDNDAVYSGSTAYGTTILYTDITATGHYTNGDTISIHPQENGVNPSAISAGGHEYTITFANNITKTITIVGQSLISSRAFISGFPTNTGPKAADGPYPSPTLGTHNWPLWVEVTHSDPNLGVENMTYELYLILDEEKEAYDDPDITIANTSTASVGLNGTLTYDFSGSNYAYDSPNTKISSITINHESDSSKNKSISNITINADRFDTTYFSSFTSTSLAEVTGVETFSGYHNSESSSASQVLIAQDSSSHNGVVYKLPSSLDYYIHAPGTGGSYSMAVISLPSGQNITNEAYTVDNVNIKFVTVDSSTRNIYIHHTPTSGYTTYLVMGLTFASTLYLLTK